MIIIWRLLVLERNYLYYILKFFLEANFGKFCHVAMFRKLNWIISKRSREKKI